MQNYAEDRSVISSKNNRVIFFLLMYMLHPDSVCNDYFTEWQIFYLLNDIPGLGHDNGPGVLQSIRPHRLDLYILLFGR